MFKRSLLLLSVLFTATVLAQIPNAGFESWIPGNWLPSPEGWTTPNDQLNVVVTPDIESFEGNFAMRVDAVENGLGAFGWAETTVPIDYIPASLDFYVKSGIDFGGVGVSISFYNNEFLFSSFYWGSGESIDAWTLVSLELEQNEPILTHAVIRVDASVGDLVAGTAWISLDAMGFDGPLSDQTTPADDQFQIYPNPASDVLTIKGSTEEIETISIYDISGKLVDERSLNASFAEIDISGLPAGSYTTVANVDSGNRFSQKLLIAR